MDSRRNQRDDQGDGADSSRKKTRIRAVASKGLRDRQDLVRYGYAALEDFAFNELSAKGLRAVALNINAVCNASSNSNDCEREAA